MKSRHWDSVLPVSGKSYGKSPERRFLCLEKVSKGVPISEKGAPISKKGVPISKKGVPISEKGVPISEKGVPIFQKGVPISEKGAPISKKGVPIFQKGGQIFFFHMRKIRVIILHLDIAVSYPLKYV
ncbi:MAG: hypothetical protein LBK58_03700 [Prevotellaceae bacterium]|jgi:hypothetical protein|nr:hypothetical protein [Prevotellaceae bacterium]